MNCTIVDNDNPDRIFFINRSDLDGSLDANYYKPSISTLEKLIRCRSTHSLKDYAKSIAGGATPKKTEADKYYSDSEHGVPFLRVQNLQTNGELSLEGCLYINKETHNGLLARSQVSEGDLLVKITGVGRMAVASVAPQGFVGNTNQHMVVIKTNDTTASKYLARYLNLDIIEKIASRHSTGGTRPALDYTSLKNIPIIENIDFTLIDNAIAIQNKKNVEAQLLLDSINDYLLEALGITLPDIDSDLSDRIFCIKSSELVDRLDPRFNRYSVFFKNISSSYSFATLNEVLLNKGQYGANESAIDYNVGDVRYIRITDIDELGYLKDTDKKTASTIDSNYLLKSDDILFARSGSVGKCYIHKDLSCPAIFAGYLIRFDLDKNKINPDFLFYYCNSKMYKLWVDTIQRPAVQANINAQEFRKMIIPLPPLQKQEEISKHILELRQKANSLREEGKQILQQANKEVEQMILG